MVGLFNKTGHGRPGRNGENHRIILRQDTAWRGAEKVQRCYILETAVFQFGYMPRRRKFAGTAGLGRCIGREKRRANRLRGRRVLAGQSLLAMGTISSLPLVL